MGRAPGGSWGNIRWTRSPLTLIGQYSWYVLKMFNCEDNNIPLSYSTVTVAAATPSLQKLKNSIRFTWVIYFDPKQRISAKSNTFAGMQLTTTVVITWHSARIGSYFFLPSDIRSSVMGQYRTDTDAVDRIGTSLMKTFEWEIVGCCHVGSYAIYVVAYVMHRFVSIQYYMQLWQTIINKIINYKVVK